MRRSTSCDHDCPGVDYCGRSKLVPCLGDAIIGRPTADEPTFFVRTAAEQLIKKTEQYLASLEPAPVGAEPATASARLDALDPSPEDLPDAN